MCIRDRYQRRVHGNLIDCTIIGKMKSGLESKLTKSLDELVEENKGERKKFSRRPERKPMNEKARVFVDNLNYKTSWQDLKDHMKEVGTVEKVIIYGEKFHKSEGRGMVQFSSEEDAQKAITELNGSTLAGREIKVLPYSERPEKPKMMERRRSREFDFEKESRQDIMRRQLYVGNLPFSLNWIQLKDIFRKFARVERAYVVTNRGGLSKGFGYVLFDSHKEASIALKEMKGAIIEGREIQIDWDTKGYID
eukprot:TRINITY_DN2006_c0_g1_i1.p1 TRINITY_DN2006_c0_g1~~TRINITY_DN2006_c0_g1_i1.p1  ORF type:complete len:251 (-),score=53.61 TRINITY_DN2006_c0_g1_i1:48-800(-)